MSNKEPDDDMLALLRPEALEMLEDAGLTLRFVAERSSGEAGANPEVELEDVVRALRRRVPSLQRMQQLASLGEIGAGVVHETRNLLTAVLSFSQVGQRKPAKAPLMLGRIEGEARRCIELLATYLRFVRDAAQTEEESVSDPSVAAAEIAILVGPQLKLKRIRLIEQVETELPRVGMRHGELIQVLLNLMVNAMYATPEGGTITIGAARVGDDAVELTVSDTGPGISEDALERIFEAYFTTKPTGEGSGLGLAISRKLVVGAGGELSVDPAFEPGACLRVHLPVEREAGR